MKESMRLALHKRFVFTHSLIEKHIKELIESGYPEDEAAKEQLIAQYKDELNEISKRIEELETSLRH